MKKLFLLFITVASLSGCAEIEHQYGPYPFGDATEYKVAYVSATGNEIYQCLLSKLNDKGYQLEYGAIEENTVNAFFVTKAQNETGRIDIDTSEGAPAGSVRVGVYARDKHALRTLMPALETCKKEVEHQGFADLLFDSLFKRQ